MQGIAGLIVAVSLFGAQSAQATPSIPFLADYQLAAARHFPVLTCGPVVISDESYSYTNDYGPEAADVLPGCTIRLSDLFRPLRPLLQCNVIVHEYGHLAGLGHSTDFNDVMYPYVQALAPECEVFRGVLTVTVKKAKKAKKHPPLLFG